MNAADQAIAFARAQIGKPYQFGATGPNSYDCSGLVYAAYKSAGVSIGRTTFTQIFNGQPVSKSQLLPGDLVFPDSGHVQLYVGGNQIVEAPHTGANVRQVAMWGFWSARRVTSPGSAIALASATTTEVGLPNITDLITRIAGLETQSSSLVAAVQSLLNVFNSFTKVTGFLSDPKNWYRLAIFGVGTVLLLIALEQWTKAPSTVAKGVVSVAS